MALYAGHLGVKQALDVVIAAARRLRGRGDIRFVIAGAGPLSGALKDASADLPNVLYLPLQPAERLNELLGMADLHLLPQHRGVADLVMPSKLGGMLASGRPIVAAADPGSELFDVLTDVALLTPAGRRRGARGGDRAGGGAGFVGSRQKRIAPRRKFERGAAAGAVRASAA